MSVSNNVTLSYIIDLTRLNQTERSTLVGRFDFFLIADDVLLFHRKKLVIWWRRMVLFAPSHLFQVGQP